MAQKAPNLKYLLSSHFLVQDEVKEEEVEEETEEVDEEEEEHEEEEDDLNGTNLYLAMSLAEVNSDGVPLTLRFKYPTPAAHET